MSTSDACAREGAWLATSGDGLPALLTTAGGPFEIVQAYWPGAKFAGNKSAVYVQRTRTILPRFGGARIMPGFEFQLKAWWPVKVTTAGIAETEAQNFDNAIELLLQRIDGLPLDKTHGGRFLSAGEGLEGSAVQGLYPVVTYLDPEVTIPQSKALRAQIAYPANDREIFG